MTIEQFEENSLSLDWKELTDFINSNIEVANQWYEKLIEEARENTEPINQEIIEELRRHLLDEIRKIENQKTKKINL